MISASTAAYALGVTALVFAALWAIERARRPRPPAQTPEYPTIEDRAGRMQ